VFQGQAADRQPLQGVFIEATDLTREEMSQVRDLARKAGKAPWLIYGFRHGLGAKATRRRTQLEIYLQPDLENGRVRRGRVLYVEIDPGQRLRGKVARVESIARYAHVLVPGRRPNDAMGKWDAHRPFVVEGEFDDGTLHRVVAFIRRSPEGPRLPTGEPGRRIDGSLTISRVRRTENGTEVTLNRDDYHGAYVTLDERSGRFEVVKHSIWIV
jgi:hypothetical protein